MKIILANGKELNPITAVGGKRHVQGASRDTLSFVFPESADLDELDKLFSPENCETIHIFETVTETVIAEDGTQTETVKEVEHLHSGYTVRAELKREPVVVTPATEEAEAVTENRVTVSMSQRTYAESQMASLTETVDYLVLESLM